jgi:acyl carrier protein
MTAIEQAHGIELSDDEIASINTLQDLLHLTKAETGDGGPHAGE